jgi:Ca2+-binding RTX toxin-like protein
VHVNAGGLLRVQDTVGTASNASTGAGYESVNVGCDSSSNGTLEVSGAGSSVSIVGTGTSFNVDGDFGATGTAAFSAGTTLVMRSTIAAASSSVNVGRGGIGTMTIDGATATITGGGGAADAASGFGAYLSVDRDAGSSSLTISNNGLMTFNGTSALLGTTAADASGSVGRDGGTGTVLIQSGGDMIFNGGTEGASFNVGRNSGSSTGGTGTTTVTGAGSTLVVESTGGNGFMGLGRSAGATGTLNVANGGAVTVQGDTRGHISLGGRDFQVVSGAGGSGTINITGATSLMTVRNNSLFIGAFFELGTFGGTGAINVNAGTMRFSGSAVFANLGFTFNLNDPGQDAGGSGGGTASIVVENGGRFEFVDGTGTSNLNIGRGASAASVTIRSGGHMALDDDAVGNTYVAVGNGFSTTQATLTVTGANSILDGVGSLLIGQDPYGILLMGGNGVATVESGGMITAQTGVDVGTGGRLQGHGGTINTPGSNISVSHGGNLGDAAGANQTMTINGGLLLSQGANVTLDASAAGNDLYNITGLVGTNSPSLYIAFTNFNIHANGGYQFTNGEQRVFANVTSSVFYADHAQQISISGQNADFGYYFGQLSATTYGLQALTSGATGGMAVLDFGAASTLAASAIAVNVIDMTVAGGALLAGGMAENVDSILGTAVGDTFDATSFNHGMNLDGRDGNDVLTGTAFVDTLFGGDGDDTISSGPGNDYLDGGTGNDTQTGGAGNNAIFGGAGNDFVDAGSGDDYVDGGAGMDSLNGGLGNDNLNGGGGDDVLSGGDGADFLYGGAGGNALAGGAGADNLNNQASDAVGSAFGGDGADFIYGSNFGDTLYGGAGSDNITGGTGDDIMYGGDGTATSIDGYDFLYGGAGFDNLYGGNGTNFLYGGDGNDTVNGSATLSFLFGGNGTNTLNGGTGQDYLFGGTGLNFMYGNDGNDFILAQGQVGSLDQAYGGNGDDYLFMGEGNDSAYGGAGTDALFGGGGNESMNGGAGQDYMWGGAGLDYYQLLNGIGTDVVYDWGLGADQIQVQGAMYANFAAINAGHIGYDAGSNTTVVFTADSSAYIILLNTNSASLSAANFTFVNGG